MRGITLKEDTSGAAVGRGELERAAKSLLDEDFLPWEVGVDQQPAGKSGPLGGFAHLGSITEHGRVSYTKLTAVFGNARYPGSNCGTSILGA